MKQLRHEKLEPESNTAIPKALKVDELEIKQREIPSLKIELRLGGFRNPEIRVRLN